MELPLDIVQSLLTNAKRFGLVWTLTPGTVAPGAGASTLVPVIVDGDDVAINTVSIVGAQGAGMRVMVLTVPPAGNYIIGAYGGSTARRALIHAQTFECSANLSPLTGVAQTLTGCTYTFTLTAPAQVVLQGAIDFESTVTGVTVCVGGLYLDGTLVLGFTAGVRVAGDRLTPGNTVAFDLDPGEYTVDLRAFRTAAAGTQRALSGDTSAMTVQIFQ